ncbi:MAG: SGNH/GDSL hydrolase family protein [Lacipirellulaceae bacterium]
MNRRQALQTAALSVGAATLANNSTATEPEASDPIKLSEGDVILFQGDSITDVRRNRKAEQKPNTADTLGNGYPALIGASLLAEYQKLNLKVFNRGISGNKVPALHKRWQKDCLDLKPAVLSILIGVNDIWHKINGKYEGTVATYQNGLTELLVKTRLTLPETKIVVCEPFALRCGAVNDSWFPEFDKRRTAAKSVAEKAGAIWVPFQTMFDEAISAGTKPEYWAADGVHPTLAGHALMAQTWRRMVGI